MHRARHRAAARFTHGNERAPAHVVVGDDRSRSRFGRIGAGSLTSRSPGDRALTTLDHGGPPFGMMTLVNDGMDQLLARAQTALDTGRTAEAAQTFRGVIACDQGDPRGHIGLARCLVMVGQSVTAIDRLVGTGRALAAAGEADAAYALLSEALQLDPSRLDLHVDVAELEIGCGDIETGVGRLQELATAYAAFGHVEEARCIVESIEAVYAEPGAVAHAQTGVTEPMSVVLHAPRTLASEETVLCRTVLRFPDGTVIPGQPGDGRVEKRRVTFEPSRPALAHKPRVRFRVPSAPRLEKPRAPLRPRR